MTDGQPRFVELSRASRALQRRPAPAAERPYHSAGRYPMMNTDPIVCRGMRLKTFAAVVSFLMLVAVTPLGAQSLADLARQEEARRKTTREPTKVYTNKDLGAPPPSSAPVAPSPGDATKAANQGQEQTKEKDDKDKEKPAAEKGPVKDQAYWAGRRKTIQDQIDRNQTYTEALQSRINALNADFVNRDDPAQRAVIDRDRQKAAAELGRLKQDIQQSKKALADFEEEARRAGVPPGWLL